MSSAQEGHYILSTRPKNTAKPDIMSGFLQTIIVPNKSLPQLF
jgi:hypothetical protein